MGSELLPINFNLNICTDFTYLKYPKTANKINVNFLDNVDNFTDQEWKALYGLSQNTFVEETDSLKNEAAGAGLTDND